MKISKEIKDKGKVVFDAPDVKERKSFAPATKKEKPKKGKGSYDRKKFKDEDEETVNKSMPSKSKKQKKFFGAVMGAKEGKGKVSKKAEEVAEDMPKKEVKKFLTKENSDITDMLHAIIEKKYSDAHKYLNQAVQAKLKARIESEIDTPLFK